MVADINGGRTMKDAANWQLRRYKTHVFAWSDREIDDGIGKLPRSERSRVGRGPAWRIWPASMGMCLDYFENYRGGRKVDPRGPTSEPSVVYRGGS